MTDGQDEILVGVGYEIYALLGRIASSKAELPSDFGVLETWNRIIDEGDRFRIWASSSGLLVPGHGSLDYRVRDAETLSKTFHSFLTDLRQNFEEVLILGLQATPDHQSDDGALEDDSEPEDNNDEINHASMLNILLESIRDIVDRLLRLVMKLRSPETRLRSSRAQKFQKLDDGIDLFQCFVEFERDHIASIFQHYRRGSKLVDTTELVALPEVNSKLRIGDEVPAYLIERIALANVARRRQFAYWKSHHLKLEHHTEAAITTRSAQTQTQNPNIDIGRSHPAHTMSISTATQLPGPVRDLGDLLSTASVSEYIPSSAIVQGDTVDFPPPPGETSDSNFFYCPYCFTTCAKKTLKVKAWQAHLIHDLRPYICTYEDCKTLYQLYDTKADWIQHEIANHATTWLCLLHPNEVFDNIVAFRLHIAKGHTQDMLFKESVQESEMIRSIVRTGCSCPMCDISGLSTVQLNDHIAVHLERMAIHSLPKYEGATGVDKQERDSNEADYVEDSRFSFVKSDLIFIGTPISVLSRSSSFEQHNSRDKAVDPEQTESVDLTRKVSDSEHLPRLSKEMEAQHESPPGNPALVIRAQEATIKPSILPGTILDVKGGQTESDNEGYIVRKDGKDFFRAGRVFKILWYTSPGTNREGQFRQSSNVTDGPLNAKNYAKPMWMLVVFRRNGYSLCCPISTYNGNGLSRTNLPLREVRAHAVIYSSNTKPEVFHDEPRMEKEPVPVDMATGQPELDKASRVHFGKFHTVEWNVCVMNIGTVKEGCEEEVKNHFIHELLDPIPVVETEQRRGAGGEGGGGY